MAVAMSSGYGDDDDPLVEKALESCLCEELDEYRIISRKHDGWDAILAVLLTLDRDQHEFLARVLDRLCTMTTDFVEEHGGLHHVLNSQETLEEDVAAEREDRRAGEGYVAPSSAASFLALARNTALDEIVQATKPDALTAAYFRGWKRPSATAASPAPRNAHDEPTEAAAAQSLLGILRDADIVPQATAGLLEAPVAPNAAASSLFSDAMVALQRESPATHDRRLEELAYVTQVLVAGCAFEGRAMRPLEAARAAMATVSLGIDHMRKRANPVTLLGQASVDKLFRMGWRLLFQEVVLPAARTLEHQLHTTGAAEQARGLASATKNGKPWTALPRLRTLADGTELATLLALADEYPTLRGVLTPPTSAEHDVGLLESHAHLRAVGDFLSALTPHAR
jgi:hypothetical protein